MERRVLRQRAWSASAKVVNSSPQSELRYSACPLAQKVCRAFHVGVVGFAGYMIGR
jgi:hypothetical protein